MVNQWFRGRSGPYAHDPPAETVPLRRRCIDVRMVYRSPAEKGFLEAA
jgi:hypothetical protein